MFFGLALSLGCTRSASTQSLPPPPAAARGGAPGAAAARDPAEVGDLDLEGFCRSISHVGVTLEGAQRGPQAMNNWRCVTASGDRVSLDMNAACRHQYGAGTAARALDPDDAYSWRCLRAAASTGARWQRHPDVAAYWNVSEGASWGGLLRIERGLTLEQATERAAADPEVTYFFFTTGEQMVLEQGRPDRIFHHGDTAFFRGSHWWGSAPGLADGYSRPAAP